MLAGQRIKSFDRVTTTLNGHDGGLISVQSNGTWSRLPGLFLIAVLAVLIVLPQIGLAIYALIDPAFRSTLAEQPATALQLALALTFWIGLVIWPLARGLSRLALKRTIAIKNDIVTVTDITPLSCRQWSEPLARFDGIAHVLRSSLSGVRHELHLVHPMDRRAIVLAVGETLSDSEISGVAQRLSVRKLPAKTSVGSSGDDFRTSVYEPAIALPALGPA